MMVTVVEKKGERGVGWFTHIIKGISFEDLIYCALCYTHWNDLGLFPYS